MRRAYQLIPLHVRLNRRRISPASKSLIEEENAKTTRCSIAYREGLELLGMIKASRNKSLESV